MKEVENSEVDGNVEAEVEPIKQDATKGHVLDIGPGSIAVELPCGYIDGEAVHASAVVREMRGHEEDILAGSGPVSARMNAIIGNCLIGVGSISEPSKLRGIVERLMAPDRMALLIAIRRASLGDKFDAHVVCPLCKGEQHVTLDLKEVETVPMPDRMTREKTSALPSGIEIVWHVLTNDDEEWLTEKRKKKVDLLTLGLLARIDMVNGDDIDRSQGYRRAVSAVKDLSMRDRTALRAIFEKEEGKVDTNVTFECSNPDCGHEWSGKMDIGQRGFFFPSAP